MNKNQRGFYPFWFWNDKIEAEEVKFQIKEMADKGIKGFFIHPRQGLAQPYLSNSFFEMVDLAVKEAKKYDLKVGLYDEYPYPSGVAGGEVILGNPQYQATRLLHKNYLIDGGNCRLKLPAGKILSAKAYPVDKKGNVNFEEKTDLKDDIGIVLTGESYSYDGLTKYNKKRYFGNTPTPVLEKDFPDQKYKLYFSIQKKVENHKYWYNYVDVLNPDAVDEFIKLTHGRYKKHFADEFSNSITSIFADEIKPTWSNRLPAEFRKKYAYDLLEYMPALQDEKHPQHLKVKEDLYNLKYELFNKNFEEKIKNWCQDNGLYYCGEKPSLRMSQLKYMDIPGCEPGHTKAGAQVDIFGTKIRGNAKTTASADYFYDKKGSLCECYHSIGWSGTLEDAKIIAESLLLAGINYLVPHGFFYSTHSLKKHDAPPSFFFQMPFWPFFDRLSERIEAINTEFKDTYIDAEILLFEPHSGLPDADDLNHYQRILNYLLKNKISFQIVDTDILDKAEIENSYLKIRDLKINKLIIPPLKKEDKGLKTLLSNLKDKGIDVFDLNKDYNFNDLQNIKAEKNSFDLQLKSNQNLDGFYYVKRKSQNKTIYFLVNTLDKKHQLEINSNNNLKEIKLEANNISNFREVNNNYQRTVYPFESFILKESDNNTKKNTITEEITIDLSDELEIKSINKNLLRINNWNLSILDEDNNFSQTFEVDAIPIKNILNEKKFKYRPHVEEHFGSQTKLSYPPLSLLYQYQFINKTDSEVELLMEPDSLRGKWEIVINSSHILSKKDFSKTASHVRGSLAVEITDLLNQGENKIEIYLDVLNGDQGLVNPLYLAGDFGVDLKNTLVKQLDKGYFEDYKANKLPFYSGVIEYKKEFKLSSLNKSEEKIINFKFPDSFHEAAEFKINDSKFYDLLWEPRKVKIKSKNLNKGINTIQFRVYSSLIRSFEGMEFDYNKHKYIKLD